MIALPSTRWVRIDESRRMLAGETSGGSDLRTSTLLEHLDELRRRLIYSLMAVAAGSAIAFRYMDRLSRFVLQPMQATLTPGRHLIFIEPTEGLLVTITIGLMAGVVLSSPVLFLQLWLLVAPKLYVRDKRLAVMFLTMSCVLFWTGMMFGHYVVFPLMWQFFSSYQSTYVVFTPQLEPAFTLYVQILIGMGLTFQLPTVVVFLARVGLLTPQFMIRHIKMALLVISILAAALSPDGGGVGMLAMGAPVLGLYMFSIALAWMFGPRAGHNRI
jgi:sec-independent protein translocase protein TatC